MQNTAYGKIPDAVLDPEGTTVVEGIKTEMFEIQVPYGVGTKKVIAKVVERRGNDEYILETVEDNPEDCQRYIYKLVWIPLHEAYETPIDKALKIIPQLSDAKLMELRDHINSELNMLGKS